MIQEEYRQVLFERDGQFTKGWILNHLAHEGTMMELLNLPDPRNMWTVREIYPHTITKEQLIEFQNKSRNALPSINENK